MQFLKRLILSEEATTAVEYAVMLALILVAILGPLPKREAVPPI